MSRLKIGLIAIAALLVMAALLLAVWPKETVPPVVKQSEVKTEEGVKKAAGLEGVNLTKPAAIEIAEELAKETKPDATYVTTYEEMPKLAKTAEKKEKADISLVVVPDKTKLEPKTPVELNQYHVYTSPKALTEIGLKLEADTQKPVAGISYGRKWRVDKKGRYIGARADYDWKRQQAGVWVTYTY